MTALPAIELDPPTISMTFGVSDSPLAGRDGIHVSQTNIFSFGSQKTSCNNHVSLSL